MKNTEALCFVPLETFREMISAVGKNLNNIVTGTDGFMDFLWIIIIIFLKASLIQPW